MSAQTENKTCIVACGVLANVRDLGEWIDAPSHAIFGFSPSARHWMFINFPDSSLPVKPAYLAIVEYSPAKPIIVFAPLTFSVDG